MNDVKVLGVNANLASVLISIVAERERQDELWGDVAGFGDDPEHTKLAVLMKKLGDFAVAVAQGDNYFVNVKPRSPRQELTELAAVCVALLEEYDV